MFWYTFSLLQCNGLSVLFCLQKLDLLPLYSRIFGVSMGIMFLFTDKIIYQWLCVFKEIGSGPDYIRMFSWEHVKNLVHSEKIQDVNHLRQSIINCVAIITWDMLAMTWEEVGYVTCYKQSTYWNLLIGKNFDKSLIE